MNDGEIDREDPTRDEPADEEATLVGVAGLVGAFKGALAGGFFVLGWLAVLLFADYVARPRSLTPKEVLECFAGLCAGAFAGATLCGFDAAARHLSGARALLARLAAGALTPVAIASPFFGFAGGHFKGALTGNEIRAFALAALGLAAAQIAAGRPRGRAYESQGCLRLAAMGIAAPVAGALGFFLGTGKAEVCEGAAGGAMVGLFVAFLFWVSQQAAAPFARRLAFKVAPALGDATRAHRIFERELSIAEQALEALAADPSQAGLEHLRRQARQALDRADQVCQEEGLSESRPRVALRRAELHMANGDYDAAEGYARLTAFEPAIVIELARRRGVLDHAGERAQQWVERVRRDPSFRGRSAHANALLLLALVRADEGRLAEARASLAEARKECLQPQPLFAHLTFERVEAYIRACTDRSPPA